MTATMNRLKFYAARLKCDDIRLNQTSSPKSDLIAELTDKSVAIIGNSRALAETSFGAEIDAADIVIRINRAPMPSASSHGSKTNWLALATKLEQSEETRINPERIFWMSPKRKRLPFWVVSRPGFYLNPQSDFETLKSQLNAPPTTGLMIIDLVSQSKAKAINLYGFDFFASLSLTGSRTAEQVPHDFDTEKSWVADLAKRDRRLTVHR